MAKRERRADRLPEGWFKTFIEAYDIKTKNDSKNKATDNSRNGTSFKTLRSDLGEIEIDVPRDRDGEFAPKIIPKHQRDMKGLDSQIISMYGKGMSTRDIASHIESLYGAEISADTISRITDKILPEIKEWQNRPLKPLYARCLRLVDRRV